MKMEILSNSIKTIDRVIQNKSPNEDDYIVSEFMCFILNIDFSKNEFIFDIIKAEYMKQSKIIDIFIINSKKLEEIDIMKMFIKNSSFISPFIFGYVERNI